MMKVLCSEIRHQDLLIFRLKLFKSLISTLSKTWFNIVSTISVALVTLQTFWRLYVNEEIYSWNSEEYQEQCLSFGLNGEFCNDQKGKKKAQPCLEYWSEIIKNRARLKIPFLRGTNASDFTQKRILEKVSKQMTN